MKKIFVSYVVVLDMLNMKNPTMKLSKTQGDEMIKLPTKYYCPICDYVSSVGYLVCPSCNNGEYKVYTNKPKLVLPEKIMIRVSDGALWDSDVEMLQKTINQLIDIIKEMRGK